MPALDQKLSSADVIAALMMALEQDDGEGIVARLAGPVLMGAREYETLRWLGATPSIREWIGQRHAVRPRDNEFVVRNVKYEATLNVFVDELRRDRFGMIQQRINELADRQRRHWYKLLLALINAGATTACYDGQFFFDTDHSEGDSGTQSNDITVDISALPVPADEQGSITAPSPKTLQLVVQRGIEQIVSFIDDQGEPMNEMAMEFHVVVPTTMVGNAITAVSAPQLYAMTNSLAVDGAWRVTASTSPSITETDAVYVFRTDGNSKPFVRIEERPLNISAIAEGSETEFREDRHEYGIDFTRAADYGMWQHACLVTMV